MGAYMLSLQQLVAQELSAQVLPQITDFAEAIAASYPGAARGVLFYGSCLRSEELEGQMLDFYLIVSSYQEAYGQSWLVRANTLLPPNVFPFQHNGLMAKVAVLSEADFHILNRPEASAVSVWARFAQPSRLVWCADEVAQRKIIMSIAGAAPTLLNVALAQTEREVDIIDLWQSGFSLTYSAELRAERTNRPASVVEHDTQRYEIFGAAALHHTMVPNEIRGGKVYLKTDPENRAYKERRRWPGLRRRGKMLTVARLAKAAFTYTGGIDYLAWKVNKHAGTDIQVRDWQRRWPLVAAVFLVPKLLVKGAVR
jgi:hypothetical protein